MKTINPVVPKKSSWYSNIINSWIFIPVFLYFNIVNQYALNIPTRDDYDVILNFLYEFKTGSLREKIILLFSQDNEHRLLHSHLLYALYYILFDHINFRHLIIIGNLQLVAISLISAYFIRKVAGKYWTIAAFIWNLCLFDLNTYENGNFAMACMQNYGVIMLFLLSLFLYSRNNKFIIPAACLQALCIFSSGNGMVASLFIVILALLSKDRLKKIVSIAVMLIFVPLYFTGYTQPPASDGTHFSTIDLSKAIPYFVKETGAHFSFDYSLISGMVVLVVLLMVFPYRKLRTNSDIWPILCILGFLIATMGTIALFRSNLKGAQFQTSRYLIYPQLIAATTCLFILMKLDGLSIRWPVTIILLLLMLKTYSVNFQFGKSGFEREAARAERYEYYYPDRKRARMISDNACNSGIYCLQEER
jgi:hypothetical protein